MHYTKVVVVNQKSYLDTSIITLEQGINLIVGKNNSGKTTLLEILSGKIDSVPHLSEEKKQRKEAKLDTPQIAAGIEFFVSREELKVIAEDSSYGKTLYFSNDNNSERLFHYGYIDDFGEETWYYDDYSNFDFEFYDPELEPKKIEISGDEVNSYFKQLIENGLRLKVFLPSLESKVEGFHKKIVRNSGNICTVGIDFHPEGLIAKYSKSVSADYEVGKLVSKEFIEKRVYKFDIHRVVQAKNEANELGLSLSTDCRNLPSALNYLKGDPPKYQELENLVKEVFPEINRISISQENGVTIKIWLPQTTRADLAINLSACGTGVGQVIAMLFVVVNSYTPQVIIIDEPNSFLHPSASRKLIEIFKRYDQHQYIISTHSPEVISVANPENIILLKLNEKGQTQVQKIDRKSREHMQQLLDEVGGRLSDVFGYDQILWVEGETEELCFQKIVEKKLKKSLTSSPIRRVHDTGSFEEKHIQTTLYIYKRLVEGDALIPPSLAFIFDREGRSKRDIEDLERQGKGNIHFLKRRLYENYLLDFEAIEAVLKHEAEVLNEKSIEVEWVNELSCSEIEKFVQSIISNRKFWDNKAPKPEQEKNWLTEIHASKLLETVFLKFTDNKIPYRKTTHSVAITEWLIDNRPEALQDLVDLLKGIYEKVER